MIYEERNPTRVQALKWTGDNIREMLAFLTIEEGREDIVKIKVTYPGKTALVESSNGREAYLEKGEILVRDGVHFYGLDPVKFQNQFKTTPIYDQKTFWVFAKFDASIGIGEFKAESPEDAIEIAEQKHGWPDASLCQACSDKMELEPCEFVAERIDKEV